jgi:hypothetical protein
LALAVWLPWLHLLFTPRLEDYWMLHSLAPKARALAARQIELWERPALHAHEAHRMRGMNAEWDLMGRMFLALALANMCLREPEQQGRYLAIIDRIISFTQALERERGCYVFLIDYAHDGKFAGGQARSLFVDGELALMLGARRLIRERDEYRAMMAERCAWIEKALRRGPVLCAESYPNECWMFCNTVALAALRIQDLLDGRDHAALIRDWARTAREKLTHPQTGLLVSSFSYDGHPADGPEGSSIWMVSHCLKLVDEELARDQYTRARRELAGRFLGFGYAREWPASWRGRQDVDSGPLVPLLEASASSSGLALLAACSFGDGEFARELLGSLNFAGLPSESGGQLKFCASNQVGDAVVLYALVQGPLWRLVKERGRR